MTLTVELVPAGQFGDNLRSRLPKAEWDALRRATYAAAGHRCEVCGGKGSRHPVAGDHVELEFRVWNRRSREAWTLDLDWLDRRGSA